MRTVLTLLGVAMIGVGAGQLVPSARADGPPAIRLAQGVGPLPSPAVNPRLGEERRFTAPAVPDVATDPAAATGSRDGVVPGNPAGRVGTIDAGHVGAPPVNAVPNPPAGAVPPPPLGAVPPPAAGAPGTTYVAPGAPAPVPLGR
jgi:hypothetical protein